MARLRSSAELAIILDRLARARAWPPDLPTLGREVKEMEQGWPTESGLYAQLRRLSDFITSTRREIARLGPSDLKENFLPKATDELDAIIEATAAATHRIMDAADVMLEVAGTLEGRSAERATSAVTTIYEACTFQDITGQRVTKVVNVLKVVEARLDAMIQALGEAVENHEDGAAQMPPAASGDEQAARDARLLNGPAAPGQEKSQAEIDALFSGGG